MAYAFPLANGQVIQCTMTYIVLDQQVQNRFDVVIANLGGGPSAATLLTSIEAEWAARFPLLISDQSFHARTTVTLVTDVIQGSTGKPKRVYGPLFSGAPNPALNGANADPALPYDVAMSVQLQTSGPARTTWGSKRFGPITTGQLGVDGESIDPGSRNDWQLACDAFFTGPILLTAPPTTFECVVIPATAIAALPLPHAPLSTLVNDIVGTKMGIYTGSQGTRRVTPFSLLGH